SHEMRIAERKPVSWPASQYRPFTGACMSTPSPSKSPQAGRALIASVLLALALPAATAQQKESSNVVDPYLWLEDVTGDKALDWARAQNARTDAELAAGPEFATLKSEVLAILDSDAKIPDVSKIG